MFKKIIVLSSFLMLFILTGCHQTTEQTPTHGSVQGTVRCVQAGGTYTVYPAFIFWGDSLLATTDLQGSYRINDLKVGGYDLLGSALYCADTTLAVQVQGDRTVTLDFDLRSDSTTGLVVGEFQDAFLFQQRLLEDTTLADWSEKQIYDAATGATLQSKTLLYFVPDRFVSLGDSAMTTSDAWGQYGLYMPWGTYPLTGSCEGYENITRVVNVQPGSQNYINFFLPREAIAKLIAKSDRD
jgi:hypothetical protein